MNVELFINQIQTLGIDTICGVPDSTLQEFCNYLQNPDCKLSHYVTANEGAAVGLAVGNYLATGNPACVYMQNSGLGNTVNPITSITNEEVYHIPALYVIGWRGEPNTKDEPQHKYMGKITTQLLDILQISYDIISDETTDDEFQLMIMRAKEAFENENQYAFIIKKGAFEKVKSIGYHNQYTMKREDAIKMIVDSVKENEMIISTTGKISREAYEQSDAIKGHHNNLFLTVGGMGHASMIAYGVALKKPENRVYCLDGDGAMLMHTGSMLQSGKNPLGNLVHICLNNEAHESVGGMATCAIGTDFAQLAKTAGYESVFSVQCEEELKEVLEQLDTIKGMVFIEVKVLLGARDDLGRPKETAQDNKLCFMEWIGEK